MMTFPSEAGEKMREQIMQEQRKDDMFDELLKQAGARSSKRESDILTCSEVQVETILSEGESA
ncbi:MAG TPA: hypothetical protein VE222_11715 [Nitrospiraceae bacterium]|nr:hypothetical protein [Nitrospiraceae bacterium]